jgi:hypothetical protein
MTSVELLFWEGCPSHPAALSQLRHALAETGHADVPVQMVRIESEEQADREDFVGSPTIRVDGADLMPPPPGEPTGLNCRVYRLRDGRFSPTPDPDDLRDSLGERL